MAVIALNESCAVRATRKFPDADCTSAAEPTAAKEEVPSTDSVMALFVTPAVIVGNAGTLLGDVGLPLQLSVSVPMAMNETAWVQNSRRVGLRFSMRETRCNRYAAKGPPEVTQNPR